MVMGYKVGIKWVNLDDYVVECFVEMYGLNVIGDRKLFQFLSMEWDNFSCIVGGIEREGCVVGREYFRDFL